MGPKNIQTIMGHSPMSQTYANKTEFRRKTLQYLGEKVLTEPLKMHVVNIVVGGGGGGGEEESAAVEMRADAVCKNGEYVRNHFMSVLRFSFWLAARWRKCPIRELWGV
jgi:ketosteroid isomerase-like protein